MSVGVVALIGILYLILLFIIANYAEKKSQKFDQSKYGGVVYALSLGVYCTAWTYYGSVERAATNGIDFIAIYLGPTIVAVVFYPVLRKIMRISKVLHFTSLADFISVRYGKSFSLGLIVSLFCVLGVIPYMALQIKAIVLSFEAMTGMDQSLNNNPSLIFTAVVVTVVMCVFSIFYGTKHLDPSEKHKGLVTVIAFESFIKLIAFLVVGIYITYFLFDGFGDIFNQISQSPDYQRLFTLDESVSYSGWFSMIVLSMFAMLFLPRQFHISVVENTESTHLKTASWLFPLYLLLINVFVLPIAFGGLLMMGDDGISYSNFALMFPLNEGSHFLSILVWIGGLSAASGMIIVESIALSIMLSNNLVTPIYFKYTNLSREYHTNLSRKVLFIRRISIVFVLLLALLYFLFIGKEVSLVNIGLVSFCAVTQFAPSVIGGLYWRQGTQSGAVIGMLGGICMWFITLIVPGFIDSGHLDAGIAENGWLGIEALKPTQLFGIDIMDKYAHSLFWSMLVNISLYILFSMYRSRNSQEIYYSELYVDIFLHSGIEENRIIWKGVAMQKDLELLLGNFLGRDRALNLLTSYARRHKMPYDSDAQANARMVTFTERILSGVVGAASARILMKNTTKEEDISLTEVVNILRENQQMIHLNKELRRKSTELSKATEQLQLVNSQLLEMDEQKDEFLYTVTHEIRTPLTSIKALSEILFDNDDIPEDLQKKYLESIVNETTRLAHLISSVLKLEKFESGRQRLNLQQVDLQDLISEITQTYQVVLNEKKIRLSVSTDSSMMLVSCDRDMITQVLVNLIDNASKFAQKEVMVHTHYNEDEWQIWISDDGPGVEDDSKMKIFDKFFQAKNQTLKKPGGSGLGLAISSKIIELHGGKIWVENRKPHGSHFVITIPLYFHIDD